MKIKYILFFIYSLFLVIPGNAQSLPETGDAPFVNYLTDQHGLPNYTVYKIFKDSRGMMWFGTFNGICRFDGRSFTHFSIDCPKPLNAVTDITETEKGEILFGTRNGLYLVDETQQNSRHVCPQIGFVNSIGKVGGTVLVGASNGLWIYRNPEEAEAVKISNSVISKGNSVNDITDDGKGNAWFCTDERLIHLNLSRKSLKSYTISKEVLKGYLRNITRCGDIIYLGTRNCGLIAFDPATGTARKYVDVDCPVISDLYSNGKDSLYVSTDGNGACIIHTRTDRIVRTFRTDTPDFPLSSNAVYTFWYDKELGIHWFGFAQDGTCYNYYRQSVFRIYRYKDFDTGKLSVRSFCIHGDDIAIGTREGLWFVSEPRGIVHYFPPSQLGGRIVTNIQYFGGHFVIATYEKGLCTINPKTLELKHLDEDERLRDGNFSRIEATKGQQLFVCSNMGLFALDTTFHVVHHFHSRNSGLPDAYINDIRFDLTGKGWIGTLYQLALYDPQTQTIQSHGFPEGFFSDEANLTFNLCRNGDMLAVSETSVYRAKSDLSGFISLDLYGRTKVGNIFFITENRQGKYWIGTDRGLFLFEKDLKNYRQFNATDNLPSLKFNRNQYQETPDGTFWFGTTGGLISLPRENTRLLTKGTRGKVILGTVSVDGLPMQPAAFCLQAAQHEIHLDWNFHCQSLTFSPILLNYGCPQGRYYECSVDDGEYRSYMDGETIRFNGLSLGNHKLKIRLAGHEETATTWQISVRPSILFYLETLLFIMLLLAGWQMHAYGTKRMRLKEAMARKHRLDLDVAAQRAVRMRIEEERKKKQEEEATRLQAMYQKSKMHQNEYKVLHKKVKVCMEEHKLYTNPNLRLPELATLVDCTPSKLSQMFNQYLKTNFFDFISQYRVQEFKRRMTHVQFSQYTMSAVAESCGFKRSSFFATFKKFEQCTPLEWIQKKEKGRTSKNKTDEQRIEPEAAD